ncbi:MAG: hypothetical protein DWH79_08520 [Planctomycetota bacterium]|nr:MAG: hypothetical protein DWH79_08520 [Planctomycetota bacterium]
MRSKKVAAAETVAAPPGAHRGQQAGFTAPPADGGLSIDRLAQAFASMMGVADPYSGAPSSAPGSVAEVDPSPDLDDGDFGADSPDGCRVSPTTILAALLFVGLPGGVPLSGRKVAALMRGVRPQEIDELALELSLSCRANNCPYDVVSQGDGWVMRLREEFASFGRAAQTRSRLVRLDSEALDVLAAVAWNQPVARDKLVELGCDAPPSVLRLLVRRGLLELKSQEGGEPCYRTTRKFLDVFRLARIEDLPEPNAPPG